jgi:hypothetical protein
MTLLDLGPMEAGATYVLSFGRDAFPAPWEGVIGRRRAGWPGGGRNSRYSRRISSGGAGLFARSEPSRCYCVGSASAERRPSPMRTNGAQ